MEDKPDIRETRLQKERDLLKSLEAKNYSVTFPDNSRSIEVFTEIKGFPIKFFIHLPERYPFQPPKVAQSISPELISLTQFKNDEDILEHVLGESWIPAINLHSLIEKLVFYARHSYKPKERSLMIDLLSMRPGWGTVCLVLMGLLLRVSLIAQPHSGHDNAPKFGDYEAQRHWMEITYNLSPEQWYLNSTNNDLNYWGLDYPPLTAWHSYVMGTISASLEPESMVLHESRGYLTSTHKLFMRLTVIISDLLVFFPGLLVFFKLYYKNLSPGVKFSALILILGSPPILLVDHGHFQYNTVMLGFSLWAVLLALYDYLSLSAIMLALALNFKQMSLYYALPFGFLWLIKAWKVAQVKSLRFETSTREVIKLAEMALELVNISGSAILATVIIWIPWVYSIPTVVKRIFPLQRGVFEDKVASFWCVTSIIIKYKALFEAKALAVLAGLLTLGGSSPFLYLLFKRRPLNLSFLHSLAGVSLSFFLFSYHVHEKTILLPLLPISLLTIVDYPETFQFFTLLSSFSMYPLMVKDGLVLAYLVLNALFVVFSRDFVSSVNYLQDRKGLHFKWWYLGMGLVHLVEFFEPPERYPYLFETLVAVYSFVGFLKVYLQILKSQYVLKGETETKNHLEKRFRKKAKMT